MNPKIRSLFPLTQRQSLLGSLFFSWFLYLPATLITPVTGFMSLIHPLWVLAFYFSGVTIIRMLSEGFVSFKNPELVMRMVVGPLQILAGVSIVVGGIILGADSLWAGVSAVLWFFGARNITGAVYILRLEAYERQQEKRVEARQVEYAAQEARAALEWLERAEQDRNNEAALMEDLTAFLADADQAGNGRADA